MGATKKVPVAGEVQYPPTPEFQQILAELREIKGLAELNAKQVLNLDDAAALTGLSKSYLYKLTSTHQLPFSKPCGRTIFIGREDLQNWLMRHRQPTTEERLQEALKDKTKKGGRR